jgi:hypothetical protein
MNRKGVPVGVAKKEKSSLAFPFQKCRKWVSKGVFSFLHQASDKSRTFSSMPSIRELLVVNIDDEKNSRRESNK